MSVDTSTMSESNPTFASEVNAFQEVQSTERQQHGIDGVNSVERPENSTAGQNTGFPNSTAHGERGLVTRNDEGADGGDFARKPRAEQNLGQGYLDEIKRRKFQKKAKSKLFVGGLVLDVREDFLRENFEKYGEIIDACIVYEKGTNVSRGFGYVTFSNEKDAEEAIKGVDGMRINGKTLCVEFADDPKYTRPRQPPLGHRSRSRSPHRPRGRYPSPPPQYRDRFYDRDPYYERNHYGRDHYESERYCRQDPHYPPTDYYRPPPSHDYYRSPARMPPRPPVEYKDRFGRDIPPPPSRAPTISDVDHARLRVNRERLREPEHDERQREYRYYASPSPEQGRMQARRDNYGNSVSARERGHGYSDSNSSDDDNDDNSSNAKPRQVSAFPSAYLK